MPSPANVSIERDDHEFVLTVNGERAGFLDYNVSAGVMRIEYVEVSPELRGTGLGKQLVERAVGFAQEGKLRVVPICGYARAVVMRDPALSAATREL